MNKEGFSPDAALFHPITLMDKEELFPILQSSSDKSCEFAFGNLFAWKTHTGLLWQNISGRPYFYYKDVDKLAFSVRDESDIPTPLELAQVSREMQKLSASGDYFVVPPDVIRKWDKTEWEKYFSIVPAPEEELEYIYRIGDLKLLPGKLLAKKKNLISQFRKNFPSAEIEEIGRETLGAVQDAADLWVNSHLQAAPDSEEDVLMEKKAIELTLENWEELSARGVILKNEGKALGFAVGFPINPEIWAEPFEKALPGYKGASQVLLQSLAALLEKEGCLYLNREQDMGLEGLRKAKRSYNPCEILTSFNLHFKG